MIVARQDPSIFSSLCSRFRKNSSRRSDLASTDVLKTVFHLPGSHCDAFFLRPLHSLTECSPTKRTGLRRILCWPNTRDPRIIQAKRPSFLQLHVRTTLVTSWLSLPRRTFVLSVMETCCLVDFNYEREPTIYSNLH